MDDKEQMLETDSIGINIAIRGENIPFADRENLKSLEIDKTLKGADTMTISLYDEGLRFIEDDIYCKDVPISCDMYFHGYAEKQSFYGYISEITPVFPEDGSPYVELYCLDKTHLMQRVKNTHSWHNVRSVDVVQEICAGYGWNLISTGADEYEYLKEETISQSNQTDIEFLEQLASNERELFIAKLIGDTFFYVRLGLLTAMSMQLFYKSGAGISNVKSFSPVIDKESKRVDVKYADITLETLDRDGFLANATTVACQTQGYPVECSDVPYGSTPYNDSAQEKAYQKAKSQNNSGTSEAEREYRDIEYNTLRGDVEFVPTNKTLALTYAQTVDFYGIGKYLQGLYYVEGLKYTYDSMDGFRQTATLIKTGVGDSMKSVNAPEPNPPEQPIEPQMSVSYNSGDRVKIVGEDAVYGHADEGVRVPNEYKNTAMTVQQVDNEGGYLLLTEIYSWVRMQDVEKV